MSEMPLVSIIVPVYNVEQYLSKCLDSIINQTYLNLEIICVNDGSTDNSLAILRNYQLNDDRIKIIDKQNEGVSRARNSALEIASGMYTMFVDADDWIELNTCEIVVREAKKGNYDVVIWSYISESSNHSQKKYIFPDNMIFDSEAVLCKLHRRFIGVLNEELAHPELADSLCPVWCKLYCSGLLKKSGIKFVDLDEIGTFEDGLFNLYVFKNVARVCYLNQHLYHYRRTNITSETAKYRPRLPNQWNHLFDIMQNYIYTNQLGENYIIALNNRISLSILGLGLNISASNFTFRRKIQLISDILSSERYKSASQKLELNYFPIYWKIFYFFAKHCWATHLMALLNFIKKIIS